jgi:hypothetical protein
MDTGYSPIRSQSPQETYYASCYLLVELVHFKGDAKSNFFRIRGILLVNTCIRFLNTLSRMPRYRRTTPQRNM